MSNVDPTKRTVPELPTRTKMRTFDRFPASLRCILREATQEYTVAQAMELVNRFGVQGAINRIKQSERFYKAQEEERIK